MTSQVSLHCLLSARRPTNDSPIPSRTWKHVCGVHSTYCSSLPIGFSAHSGVNMPRFERSLSQAPLQLGNHTSVLENNLRKRLCGVEGLQKVYCFPKIMENYLSWHFPLTPALCLHLFSWPTGIATAVFIA